MMTHFKLQSSVNLSGHPSYRRLLTFVTIVKERTYISTCTCVRSPSSLWSSYSASTRACCTPCAAQHLTTPTTILNFCEENIRDPKSNHEIHENIVPQNFGAIWYTLSLLPPSLSPSLFLSLSLSLFLSLFSLSLSLSLSLFLTVSLPPSLSLLLINTIYSVPG